MSEIWLTADEIKKREERLEYLKGPRRLEIAEMLKVARAFGDLSEMQSTMQPKMSRQRTSTILLSLKRN